MLILTNPNPDTISKDQWEIVLQQVEFASTIAMLEERCRGLEREQAMVFTMLDRQKAEQRESLQLVSQVVEGVLQAILTYQRISDGRPETTLSFVSDYEDPEVNPSVDSPDNDVLTLCARTYCSIMKRPELWTAVRYRVLEDLKHEGVSTDALGVYDVLRRVSETFPKVVELTAEEGEE